MVIVEEEWRVPVLMTLNLLFLIITLSNGAVLFIILRPMNKNRLATPTNYLVANLALTDILVAWTTIPGTILSFHDLPKTFGGCLVLQCMVLLPTKVSSFGYLALSMERFVAIKFPFKYIRHSSKRNARVLICVAWLFGIVYVGSGFYRLKEMDKFNMTDFACTASNAYSMEFMVYVQFISSGIPIAIIIIVMYVIIHLEVVAMTREDRNNKRLSIVERCRRVEGHAAIRCALLMGTFFLCQMPIGVAGILDLWFGITCNSCKVAFLCLLLVNSAINPFLYSFTNKDLKEAMYSLFRCSKSASRDIESFERYYESLRLYHLREQSLDVITAAQSVTNIHTSMLRNRTVNSVAPETKILQVPTVSVQRAEAVSLQNQQSPIEDASCQPTSLSECSQK